MPAVNRPFDEAADEDEDGGSRDVVWDDNDDTLDTPDVDEQDEELRGAAGGNMEQVPTRFCCTEPDAGIDWCNRVLQQSRIW